MGKNLALIGSVRDEILNTEELALELIRRLNQGYPQVLAERYGIEKAETELKTLEEIARSRNCLTRGGELSFEKAAGILLEDFRGRKAGKNHSGIPPGGGG